MRRTGALLLCLFCLGAAGCVKRLSVAAGPKRTLAAGEIATFGQKVEVPEKSLVVWSMGDGAELKGPQVIHAWNQAGNYPISVQVTDADGQKREDQTEVQVKVPPLTEVLPVQAVLVLLFDHPGQRLSEVPLFMERLLSSGQEANASLAAIQEQLLFDPFSPGGLKAAGIDPEGGAALVGIESGGKLASVLVLALLPGPKGLESLRRLCQREGEIRETASKADPDVQEIRQGDKDTLVVSWTIWRGHLWIGFPKEDLDPAALLSAIRKGNLSGAPEPDLHRGLTARPEPGLVELVITASGLKKSVADVGARNGGTAPSAEVKALLDRTSFLRMDLDLLDSTFQVQARLGLTGREAPLLAATLKARNPVPAFGGLQVPGGQLAVKLSLALPDFWKTVIDLSGQGVIWDRLVQSLEQMKKTTGVDLRASLLDNVGDSFLLSLRFDVNKLLQGLLHQTAGAGVRDWLEGILFLQVRDGPRLSKALDGLRNGLAGEGFIRPVRGASPSRWQIGIPSLPLVGAVAQDTAVLATSEPLLDTALKRLSHPKPALSNWPKAMGAADHQVAFLDLRTLLEQVRKLDASGDYTTILIKASVEAALGKLSALDTATLDAVLGPDTLTLTLAFGLR